MKRDRCKHIYHKETSHSFRELGAKKSSVIMMISGFNPIHRRLEICDEGFYIPKKKNIEY